MPLAEAVQSQGQCSQRKPSSQTHSPRGPRSHARTVESGQTDLHTPPALLTPPGPSRPPARRPSRQRGPRRPGSRRRRASLSSAAPSTAWLCSSCLAMAENAGCTLSAGALLFRHRASGSVDERRAGAVFCVIVHLFVCGPYRAAQPHPQCLSKVLNLHIPFCV